MSKNQTTDPSLTKSIHDPAAVPAETKQDKKEAAKSLELVAKLEAELTLAKSQLAAAEEQAKRALADYHNLRRRTEEDQGRLVRLAASGIVSTILEPLHHLELAARQLKDPGLQMVFDQFIKVLSEQGVTRIDCLNQPFDPKFMEAVGKTEVTDKSQQDEVTEIVRQGYKLYGEVIAQAQVKVGEYK